MSWLKNTWKKMKEFLGFKSDKEHNSTPTQQSPTTTPGKERRKSNPYISALREQIDEASVSAKKILHAAEQNIKAGEPVKTRVLDASSTQKRL